MRPTNNKRKAEPQTSQRQTSPPDSLSPASSTTMGGEPVSEQMQTVLGDEFDEMKSGLDRRVAAITERPKFWGNCASRELTINGPSMPFHVREDDEAAIFLMVGRIYRAYLKTNRSAQYKNWSVELTSPNTPEAKYRDGFETLKAALMATSSADRVIHFSSSYPNLKFVRYFSDFDCYVKRDEENPEGWPTTFPHLKDATNHSQDLNNAPDGQVGLFTPGAVVAMAFTVKLWDKTQFGAEDDGGSPSRVRGKETSPATAAKGKPASTSTSTKGKGRAEASTSSNKLTSRKHVGARLELASIWYLGDEDDRGSGVDSPRKMPKV